MMRCYIYLILFIKEVTVVMLMEAVWDYICRKILHMMDGEIFAENKDGCFNVTVVLKKV